MPSKRIFGKDHAGSAPPTDTRNEAGGRAYTPTAKSRLAQIAVTGCFTDTFYASAETQFEKVMELARSVDPEFIAKAAIYSREFGYMKDMPAFLCAVLAKRDVKLLRAVFNQVIDNGKMLAAFYQILRSGAVGRKGYGTAIKRMTQHWLRSKPAWLLHRWAIGQEPSLASIIKGVHVKGVNEEQRALFGYLIDRKYSARKLPACIKEYERFKKAKLAGEKVVEIPKVDFRYLDPLSLTTEEWTQVALQAPWMMTRMNLNTFQRHKVFENAEVVEAIAAKLRNAELIRKARQFPYQLMMAYLYADKAPRPIIDALHAAMEIAVQNVPTVQGRLGICVDVSASMFDAVTGRRKGSTTKARLVDVAGLITSALLRQCPDAEVAPFGPQYRPIRLEPRDTILTNARKLADLCGGGTNLGAAMDHLIETGSGFDAVVIVSDMQSWMDSQYGTFGGRNTGPGTAGMRAFDRIRRASGGRTKLVGVNLAAYETSQMPEVPGLLQIGGWSDRCFEVVAAYLQGDYNPQHWSEAIEAIELKGQEPVKEKKAKEPTRIRPKTKWEVHLQKTMAAGGSFKKAQASWSYKFQRPKANANYHKKEKVEA